MVIYTNVCIITLQHRLKHDPNIIIAEIKEVNNTLRLALVPLKPACTCSISSGQRLTFMLNQTFEKQEGLEATQGCSTTAISLASMISKN